MIAKMPVTAQIRYDTGQLDAYKKPITALRDEPRMAYAFAPSSATYSPTGGGVWVVRPVLYAPWTLAPVDRVIIGGVTYTVDGPPENWNRGPNGKRHGYAINLKAA